MLRTELNDTTKELIDMLSSLNPEQLNTVPFQGSWTAGQLGEHLLKSYGIAEILNGKTAPTERPIDERISGIKDLFLNFDIKMQSPEFIIPSDGWIDKEKLISNLKEKIGYVLDYIDNNNDLTRTCLDFELPGSGPLTRTEWIQFMTVHTQRHVHQLKNIIKKLTEVG